IKPKTNIFIVDINETQCRWPDVLTELESDIYQPRSILDNFPEDELEEFSLTTESLRLPESPPTEQLGQRRRRLESPLSTERLGQRRQLESPLSTERLSQRRRLESPLTEQYGQQIQPESPPTDIAIDSI